MKMLSDGTGALGKIRGWIADRWDDLATRRGHLTYLTTPFLWPLLVLFSSLLMGSALFVMGGVFGDVAQKAYASPRRWLDISVWREHIEFPVGMLCLGAGYVLNLLGNRQAKKRVQAEAGLYQALRSFYDDLGFGDDLTKGIRCTIWTPLGGSSPNKPKMHLQAVNYVPEKIPRGAKYQILRKAGRTFAISRIAKEIEMPIGLLGKCTIGSLNDNKAMVEAVSVPAAEDLAHYMQEHFNYDERQAKDVAKNDRRSLLCLTIMDRGCRDVMALVYCDAFGVDVFTPDIVSKAEALLPRIARALSP